MSQTSVNITPGTGKVIDGFSTSGTANIRQAVVLGDPTTDANVATVTSSNALKVDGSAVTQPTSLATNTPVGPTASGSTLTVNPLTVGGRAASAIPTAVTDGQVVNAMFTSHGKLVTSTGGPRGFHIQQQTTITSSTSETTVLTAVASTFLDVYGVIVTNSSATAVNVSFKDATSGTERFRIAVPATDTRGFMINSSNGHQQAVVNNNWTATSSGSVASLYITMFALKTS